MSLILSKSGGVRITARNYGGRAWVVFGGNEIDIGEFFQAVTYVLTSMDLLENDPRRKFVEMVRSLEEVEGQNIGFKQLADTRNKN